MRMKRVVRFFIICALTGGCMVACKKDDAPEPTPAEPVNCDNDNVGYANRIEALVVTHCRGCHNNNIQNGGLNLATFALVQEQALNGNLVNAIYGTGGLASMPPGGSLSACDLEAIEIWVENGAEND